MIVVPPLEITDARLTSTPVAEPNAPAAYNAGTTYAIGNQVTGAGNRTYQSLQSGNLAHQPDLSPLYWSLIGYKEVAWASGTTYVADDYAYYDKRVYQSLQAGNTAHNPYVSPDWWQDVGPTNKWAMFDFSRNSATVAAPFEIELTPSTRVDTLSVIGVIADSVRVRVYNGVTVVYDETQELLYTSGISDWFEYFTAYFSQSNSALFRNLPPITGAVIKVTFARSSGNVSCGGIVIGKAVPLGAIQYGPTDGALNFSTIDRDRFGNATLIQRRSVPKTNQITWAEYGLIKNIRAAREQLNAVPALWAGVEEDSSLLFDSFLIFGIYKEFSISVAYASHAVLTLELEEI